jgi:hypothetical protein
MIRDASPIVCRGFRDFSDGGVVGAEPTMRKLDYSSPSAERLSSAQTACVAISVVAAIVGLASTIACMTLRIGDSALVDCYIFFLLSDAWLATMLSAWRARLRPVPLVVGWLLVSLGLLSFVLFAGLILR